MSSSRQIVGVMLVRNEDLHVEWALSNILDFCDRIIVLDNYSTDRTYDVVSALAKRHDKIELRRWWNAKTSQKALRRFYQTDTWLFRVDGDEVYDPSGLAVVRRRIKQGEFDLMYKLPLGCQYLNCTAVSADKKTAMGYPYPTSPSLHNFAVVRGWKNENRERLHGHPIFTADKKPDTVFREPPPWDESIVRCLHLCFVPRSSGVKQYPFSFIGWKRRRKEHTKPNPSGNPHNARPGPGDTVEYKMKHYAVGEIVERDIGGFVSYSRHSRTIEK